MSALLPTLLTSLQFKFVKNYLSFLNGVLIKEEYLGFCRSHRSGPIEAVFGIEKRLMWLIFVVQTNNIKLNYFVIQLQFQMSVVLFKIDLMVTCI